ncbi:hypothetical protein, partial [Klebsiella pneumoniae]|uniref:hypothetical protein n=1 Tax=Klebsiella pneumoniae TaxID=573 RepID=UPI001E4B0D76
HAAPPGLKYADVVLLESPLSPYHFFTPGVTTQATALATPGVVGVGSGKDQRVYVQEADYAFS